MSVSRLICLALAMLALAAPTGGGAWAHVPQKEAPDDILKSIGVDERLGGRVPLDLVFRNQDGAAVRLGDALAGQPAVLTLNYFTCPMLCPIILRNLLDSAARIRGISLARDYRIVTVSIDPEERIESARARSKEIHAMVKGVGNPPSRWPFLFGGPEEIRKLTGAAGVRYRKVGAEFAHPDVAVVLTPDGRISRYLYGVEQDPVDLRLALVEAAGGRIGESTVLNRVLLFCFHYDPVERKYALYARNIMKAGGVLTLAFLALMYLALWRGRKRAI